ncbi:MAG TPA: methylthioribulose 1-phosphate dehydratase [Saprospiraceae bacterium]|nr:methylthioribulose 1-phosphate dehydratase [Saprospiraceae bacterium]HMQ83606.1 methylthioribulose 1-phosphate dehydratase [Saprospiraceae bacterium]
MLADLSQQMLAVIQEFYQRGWAMATSTNYSFRNSTPNEHTFTISRSGVDKGQFHLDDFMGIDGQGHPSPAWQHLKASAETLLHTMLYEDERIGAVLHTHSVDVTVYSWLFREERELIFQGFELQKGIEGVVSHEETLVLPVFDNAQDIAALSKVIQSDLAQRPIVYGFILRGHGLYAWGKDIATAKRHIETYEFLVTCMKEIRLFVTK